MNSALGSPDSSTRSLASCWEHLLVDERSCLSGERSGTESKAPETGAAWVTEFPNFPSYLIHPDPRYCITLMNLRIFSAGLRYPRGGGGPQSLAWVSPGSQLRRRCRSVSQSPHFLVSWKLDREERKSGPSSFGLPQPQAHPSVIPGTTPTSSQPGSS